MTIVMSKKILLTLDFSDNVIGIKQTYINHSYTRILFSVGFQKCKVIVWPLNKKTCKNEMFGRIEQHRKSNLTASVRAKLDSYMQPFYLVGH